MNLKLRWRSLPFWTGIVGVIGLIAQFVCKNYGLTFDLEGLNAILTAVLGCMVTLGVLSDPTTPGVRDSAVSAEKRNINDTAENVVKRRELTNTDYTEILSKVTTKGEEK